jgi:polysaccharide deacetylase family protein (PEP-CTERM system associated)
LKNILSVDLEEWYHPEFIRTKRIINKENRISVTLDQTLRLLDAYNVCATFFVVGELVEKQPEIVEKINERDHEIAFHGYYHEPLSKLNAEALRSEIKRFSGLIKEKCIGFRAPSFSLNNKTKWALKVLEEAGYKYDSSIFPFKTPLYGHWNAPIRPYKISYDNVIKEDEHGKLWEFSLLVHAFSAANIKLPVAGGFYLRFFPTAFISRAIKKANELGFPAVVFFHNWELDPAMPRLKLKFPKSFVTYHNLEATKTKLECLLSEFEFSSAREYMRSQGLLVE